MDGSASLVSCQEAQGPAGTVMDAQNRPEHPPACSAATPVLFLVPTAIIPVLPPTQHIKSTSGSIRTGIMGSSLGRLGVWAGWHCQEGQHWWQVLCACLQREALKSLHFHNPAGVEPGDSHAVTLCWTLCLRRVCKIWNIFQHQLRSFTSSGHCLLKTVLRTVRLTLQIRGRIEVTSGRNAASNTPQTDHMQREHIPLEHKLTICSERSPKSSSNSSNFSGPLFNSCKRRVNV